MSSSSSPKKYDVFISFRGEDTRGNFTSHLHSALRDKHIETYIDDQLNRGDDISQALEEAINGSKMAVVVFSERYATSKWCLQELVQIMERRRDEGQVVLPVFYKTNPTDVRHQTRSFQKPFEEYDRLAAASDKKDDDRKKVDSWRAALTAAANISGWHSSNHQSDSEVIANVVNDVLKKLRLRYPNKLQGLVGIEEHCKEIGYVMGKVERIGIWGMGGIGKTTIAEAIFAEHFPKYDCGCFLENVREESRNYGLAHFRRKLLSELLKVTPSDYFGSEFIKERLRSRKVLIVLDDVDSYDQVDMCLDLGQGSTLIVTTRNRHVLDASFGKIYEVKKWNFQESLVLFCLKAFKKSEPENGYENLSRGAVQYAGGVPLALHVLGSHLRSRETAFWVNELRALKRKKDQFKKIQQVLRVSYDGLEKGDEQEIFLDIAYIFKDQNKDSVIRILDACGFNASNAIEILEEKALISISNSNTIQMHDLLQEMGFGIVEKDGKDPGRRSRLRNFEEVNNILQNGKVTAEVEGIVLDLSQEAELELSDDIFFSMPSLRIAKLYVPPGKQRSAEVQYHNRPLLLKRSSARLRYLEWSGYPSKSLPPNFCAKFLVEIRMPHSDVEELWHGTQDLVNLEKIDMSECKQLKELPDLCKASKLKWVSLSGCERLCEVHPSLLAVDTLVTLILDRCKKLNSLMIEKHLSCLEELNVDGCLSLVEFSVWSDSMKRLDLSKTGVKKMCSPIGGLSELLWLNLEGLRLQNLPDELSRLTSLQELRISDCGVVDKEKLHVLFAGLQSLKLLHLKDCHNLFELPDNISALTSLHELKLDRSSVEKLPTSIKLVETLEILSLENCKKLRFLPELPLFIKELRVVNCTALVTVSTLKTFAVQMKGREKDISFMNGTKLNEDSLLRIIEDVLFSMKNAELHNVFVRRFDLDAHSHNVNSVDVCFPGSSVPLGSGSMAYQATGSSITIELPAEHFQGLGAIYSVVLSPSPVIKQNAAKIECRIYLRDDDFEKRVYISTTRWLGNVIVGEFNSDHVFAWHGFDRSVFNCNYDKVDFEFFVTTDSGEDDEQIKIKECGVHLIYLSDSELHQFLQEAADLEPELKLELGLKFQLALDLVQDGKETLDDLCFAIENEGRLDESLKLELESRRQAVLTLIENEEGKSQRSDTPKVVNDCFSYDDEEEGEEESLEEDVNVGTVSVEVEEEQERMANFADDEAHDPSIEAVPNYFNQSLENDVPPLCSRSRTKAIPQLMDSDNSTGDETAVLNYVAPANLPTQDAHAEHTSVQSAKEDSETSDDDPLADVDSLFSGSQNLYPVLVQSALAKDISPGADALALAHQLQNLIVEDLTALVLNPSSSTKILQCLADLNKTSGLPEEVKECTSSLISVASRLPTTIASAVKIMADHDRASAHKAKLVESVEQAKQKKIELTATIEKNVADIGMFDQRIAALKLAVNLMEAERQKLLEAGDSYNEEKKKWKNEAKALADNAKTTVAALNEITFSYPESAKDFNAAQATIDTSKCTLAKFISSFAKPN